MNSNNSKMGLSHLWESFYYPESTQAIQKGNKASAWSNNRTVAKNEAEALKPQLPILQQYNILQWIKQAQKGASCRLTARPIEDSMQIQAQQAGASGIIDA